MSYKTYTTEAIVCGSRANNTSDKSFLLFTREAGMLWATARSVREEKSKQRFALQDFSLIRVSLVRGKSGWRVGSVEGIRNYFIDASSSKSARGAVTSIVRLLRQFLRGESAHMELFVDTKTALDLVCFETMDPLRISEVFSLRALHKLGYVADSEALSLYLSSSDWWELPPMPKEALEATARAKQVSHL